MASNTSGPLPLYVIISLRQCLRHRAINPQTTTGSQVAEFMESHHDGRDGVTKDTSHLNECGSKVWRSRKEILTTHFFGTIFPIKLR